MKFKHTWLSIYPRPQCRMYDNEGEFTGGGAFQTMMEWAGIKDIMDRINNPDVNMVCKRMHQIFWRTCNGYCCMCSHQQMKAGGWFVALFVLLFANFSQISSAVERVSTNVGRIIRFTGYPSRIITFDHQG